MRKQEPDYLSYLLRLWRAGAEKDSPPGDERLTWRASLQSPQTGERVGFLSLEKLFDFLRPYQQEIPDIFIVSAVEIEAKQTSGDFSLENLIEDVEIKVSRAEGEKCQRCWKYFTVEGDSQSPEICGRCTRVTT